MSKFEDAMKGISDATRLLGLIEPHSVRFMKEQSNLASSFLGKQAHTVGLMQRHADSLEAMGSNRALLELSTKVPLHMKPVSAQILELGRTLALTSGSAANLAYPRGIFEVSERLSASMRGILSLQSDPQRVINLGLSPQTISAMSRAMHGLSIAQSDFEKINQSLATMASVLNSSLMNSSLADMQTEYLASLDYAEMVASEEITNDARAFAENLIQWVANLAQVFKANSEKQIVNFGIMDVLAALGFLITLQALLTPSETYSDEEQSADQATHKKLDDQAELLKGVQAAIEDLSEITEQKLKWIEALDQAVISSTRANVRDLPHGRAKAVAQLFQGQKVAIVKKKGRWFDVIYSDPVTNDLAEGWVYESSLKPLE